MPKLSPFFTKMCLASLPVLWAFLLISVIWFYRDDVFQTIYDPRQPFQTYTPPPAPNYAETTSWLIRPNPDDLSKAVPGADVFVVGPTIYLGSQHWNAPLDDVRVIRHFDREVLPNYVLPYGLAGRLYAPYYRQASLYTFMTNRDDAQQAQKFAYRDIKAAFEVFLNENPPERPIILAGHGQGGLHVQRLLAEYFKGDLKTKLAAAYIIDHPMPNSLLETEFSGLPPCLSPQDSACIIAFSAFKPGESARIKNFTERTLVWKGRDLIAVNSEPLLCINPLLWTDSEAYADSQLHLGGVAAEGLDVETLPAPSPHQTGAQCKDGLLLIDTPRQKSLRRPSRFGGKYRTLSSNLFYEDLRIDAARRAQNRIDANILPRLAPPLGQQIEIKDSPVTLPLKPIKQ